MVNNNLKKRYLINKPSTQRSIEGLFIMANESTL